MEKERILKLINKAENLIPKKLEVDLKPIKGYSNVPNWHKYENEIWEIGEEIRQIIKNKTSLRKDKNINDLIIRFCMNKKSKRGRQSFVMLLGYKHLSNYASELIMMIDDKSINGHIISTIYKMQVIGFEKEIKPFITNENTWIRKTAIKYLKKYSDYYNKIEIKK